MSFERNFFSGLVCGGLLVGGLSYYVHSAWAAGSEAKVLLENDRVRVRQVVFQPGVRPGPHTHQWAHVGVILDDGSLGFAEKGKKDETVNFKSGDAGWRDANVTHEVFNAGQKPLRVVEVELKR
jgi:beta-alanine degradation protein BauB